MELPEVKHKKGLTVVFAVDGEYCGFNFNISKRALEIRMGFAVLRVFTISESLYNRVVTISTLQESPSHEVEVTKINNGVCDDCTSRL